MDIKITNTASVYGLYNANGPQGAKKAGNASKAEPGKDEFFLSTQGVDYHAARKILASLPDVRADRVNQVMDKINAGAGEASASEIADKILSSIT